MAGDENEIPKANINVWTKSAGIHWKLQEIVRNERNQWTFPIRRSHRYLLPPTPSEPDPIPPQSPVFTISIVKVSNAFEGIQDKLHMLLLQPIWSSQQELLQNSVLDAILHIETDLTFIPFLCHDRVIQTLARMSLFIQTFQGLPKYLICDCHCPNKMPRGMYPGHLHWRCSFRYAQLQWQRLPSNRHFKHGRA